MNTIGIICEYNPLHLGHVEHINKSKIILGGDSAVVCAMSGNFVQRGEPAVFNKHARAKAAILSGADLVVEIPSPHVLSSADKFAAAGVHILSSIGICDYLSFGSESGDIKPLQKVADAMVSAQADNYIKEWLGKGLSYASAMQKAADSVLGASSEALRFPNNLLGIEYIKAIAAQGSGLKPMTVKRSGGEHDGEKGFSASAIRKRILYDEKPWEYVPFNAAKVYKGEIAEGRGPVSMVSLEQAMMSRLRFISEFSMIPGASEGLEHRFSRYVSTKPTIAEIIESVKTKRYALARIRRMIMCACLGFTEADTHELPQYIRVLAMNRTGMKLLKTAGEKSMLPIITKPAIAHKLGENVIKMFKKESDATDLYVLAYQDEKSRSGGQEWRNTPIILER